MAVIGGIICAVVIVAQNVIIERRGKRIKELQEAQINEQFTPHLVKD